MKIFIILFLLFLTAIILLINCIKKEDNFANYKYKLVVVAIFKNESHIIKEWLEHYIKQGVEYFYMIDNGSTDNWKSEITGYPVTIISDEKKYSQGGLYDKYFLKKVKNNSEWVMVLDLDEFLYARKNFKNIPDYLNTLDNNIGIIKVRWKMFGSNGHIHQPNNVINNFIKRKKCGTNDKDLNDKNHQPLLDLMGKCILRTKFLKSLKEIHNGSTKNCIKITYPYYLNEESLNESPLHLNHYAIQSYNWFMNVKKKRGDVADKNRNDNRNDEYFKNYDFNNILDTELSDLYN